MAPNFRFTLTISLLSATVVSAYGIGERQATKTLNYGAPHLVVKPTEAPSWDLFHDLLKLRPRVLNNVCTEWTLIGVEGGQPACPGSSTCLFDTISGYGYEACALTSSSYYQVTECWNYPQTYVVSPVGQIFCGSAEPYCGYYEFIFDNGDSYSNFGCSTEPYSSTATLIPGALSSYTPVITDSVITTTAPTETATPTQIVVTETPTSTRPSVVSGGSSNPSPTLVTTTHTKKKSTPIGAIVGGIIGGLAVIATIAIIAGCLCVKKRKARKQREAEAAAATAAAFQASQHSHDKTNQNMPQNPDNRYSELGGMAKPVMNHGSPPLGAVLYTNEKPGLAAQSQEMNQAQQQPYSAPTPQSPPPVYHQPTSLQYQELGNDSRVSVASPVSAIYTGSSVFQQGFSPSPHSTATELSGVEYQGPSATTQATELSGTQRRQQIDMSGAPMTETYHELHG